jgi:hypothetical protein
LLIVLGAVVGVAGVFVHGMSARVAGIPLPFGLVVALAGSAGLFVIGGLAVGERSGVLLPVLAWALTTLLFFVGRPEGDVVLDGTASGVAYLFLGTIVAAMAVGFPWNYLPGPDGRSSGR